MYLNDDRYNSSETEVGVLSAISGQGPTPPEGDSYHHRQRESPQPLMYTTQGARTRLHIRRLLNMPDRESFKEHDTESEEDGDSENEDENKSEWFSSKDGVQRKKQNAGRIFVLVVIILCRSYLEQKASERCGKPCEDMGVINPR
ncbi:hypothetical protein AVEN_144191-1 [Araneus ventricosus]|uniref:Uncharacterized protein n=1 Tax=Araneus ventricosus TaxID=182803 RepID=A0A4Y2SJA5_ARAVE|nr:hypothetical protein AVEN_144191-1 [Araneus ventricosus]